MSGVCTAVVAALPAATLASRGISSKLALLVCGVAESRLKGFIQLGSLLKKARPLDEGLSNDPALCDALPNHTFVRGCLISSTLCSGAESLVYNICVKL